MSTGPTLPPAWERSFLASASVFLFSPWVCKKVSEESMKGREDVTDLVGGATREAAENGLGCARGRVDVGLEGGGLLVRHDD